MGFSVRCRVKLRAPLALFHVGRLVHATQKGMGSIVISLVASQPGFHSFLHTRKLSIGNCMLQLVGMIPCSMIIMTNTHSIHSVIPCSTVTYSHDSDHYICSEKKKIQGNSEFLVPYIVSHLHI